MFAFDLHGTRLGTIRIVPLGYDLTLTEQLLPQADSTAPPIQKGEWEVGRLVLAPEYRSDVNALRHCMSLALEYACNHARVVGLWATCTHSLSRLYRRFGLTAVARDVPLPNSEKVYTLIRGGARDMAVALGCVAGVATQ